MIFSSSSYFFSQKWRFFRTILYNSLAILSDKSYNNSQWTFFFFWWDIFFLNDTRDVTRELSVYACNVSMSIGCLKLHLWNFDGKVFKLIFFASFLWFCCVFGDYLGCRAWRVTLLVEICNNLLNLTRLFTIF